MKLHTSETPRTRAPGIRSKMTQLLEYQDVLAAVLNRISELQRSVAIMMQNDEQKDGEKKTRKRKVDDVDIDFNNDPRKENISPHHVPKQRALPPKAGVRIKRICREKTGTEWQSVLDVLKYNEEMHESRMISVTPSRRASNNESHVALP
ncbi:hypothetical protein EV702DRAFT_1051632 [Suillus placidus]|uniref:Uncharacterized protein n=1 Tax=Suillus placidus TaxID=48579 RepID=A0A9P6ZFI6_9AGAM|nr:hypothetical protein EV702DRAFT_1051632 [Suillus placidus]